MTAILIAALIAIAVAMLALIPVAIEAWYGE